MHLPTVPERSYTHDKHHLTVCTILQLDGITRQVGFLHTELMIRKLYIIKVKSISADGGSVMCDVESFQISKVKKKL